MDQLTKEWPKEGRYMGDKYHALLTGLENVVEVVPVTVAVIIN